VRPPPVGDAHDKIAKVLAVLADGRFVSVSRDRNWRYGLLNGWRGDRDATRPFDQVVGG